jgi:hypothetical protein
MYVTTIYDAVIELNYPHAILSSPDRLAVILFHLSSFSRHILGKREREFELTCPQERGSHEMSGPYQLAWPSMAKHLARGNPAVA